MNDDGYRREDDMILRDCMAMKSRTTRKSKKC